MNQRNFAARFAAEHNRMPGRQFCWILGAGASVTSGIPAAATFAKKWLNEVIDRDTKQRSADQFPEIYNEKFSTHTVNWQDWNPESPAQYYSEIFDVCFASKPRDAFQEFEEAMRGKQGNIGYVILSKILTTTRHNLAITVNFDNLIANTVALHTTANLFVCGHETLVAHAASNHYIPQVFKVHRDLHTDPLNGQKLILADQWKPLLKRVFEHYSPIIVGYDGNDGTLMSFLEECDVGFTPYWCHLKWEDARPRVKQFVSKKSGYLVPIDGFDELLFCIGSKLPKLEDGTQYTDVQTVLSALHEQRLSQYAKYLFELNDKLASARRRNQTDKEDTHELWRAVQSEFERNAEAPGWWGVVVKAQREPDLKKRADIFRDGVRCYPESVELAGKAAQFLGRIGAPADEVEALFEKSVTEPAYQPFHICNYANYLKWRDPTNPPIPKIKSLFQRAMEIEPKSPHVLGNYADFLAQFELDDVKAKELYQKALSEAPLHLGNLVSFAGFAFIDGNISEAKLLAQRALDHWSPEYNSLFGKAEILFTIWLSLRATGEIASEIENQLIGVLQEESTPDKWTFHRLLLAADTCLSVEDRGRANVLADSILKWKKPTEP